MKLMRRASPLMHACGLAGSRARSTRNRCPRHRHRRAARALVGVDDVDQLFFVAGTTRCGDRLSTVNGPATRTRAFVDIGAVVEQFDIRAPAIDGVDFILPGYARLPPSRMRSGARSRPGVFRFCGQIVECEGATKKAVESA